MTTKPFMRLALVIPVASSSAYSLSNFSSVSLLRMPLIALNTFSSSSVALAGFHRFSLTSNAFTSMIFPVLSRSGASFFPLPLLGVRGVPESCRRTPRGPPADPGSPCCRDGISLTGSSSGASSKHFWKPSIVACSTSTGVASFFIPSNAFMSYVAPASGCTGASFNARASTLTCAAASGSLVFSATSNSAGRFASKDDFSAPPPP
mmetsp:Transcript_46477/g.95048  ORF Transcript_46477/g.95048 Transcript_46477/m.95048 type:complete len:206 (-) Transcript_46477:963-1580(-)